MLIIAFISFISLLLLAHFFSNKRSKTVQTIVDKVIASKKQQCIYLKDILIGYWFSNGNRHYPSAATSGEAVIFNDFILVVRKQKYLTLTRLKPLIVSFGTPREDFDRSIKVAVAEKFTYWDQRRKEIQIKLSFTEFRHLSAVLYLKELNDEQITSLRAFEKRHESSNSGGAIS